jgi:hypothetical protein
MAYNDGYKGPNGPYQTGRGPLTALVRLICAWHYESMLGTTREIIKNFDLLCIKINVILSNTYKF